MLRSLKNAKECCVPNAKECGAEPTLQESLFPSAELVFGLTRQASTVEVPGSNPII